MNNMRSEEEMLNLILKTAREDERIRVVMMNGSRVDPAATHDPFCDFDIIYFLHDIQSFLRDESWMERKFGKILILQKPDDWFDHPYDRQGSQPFAFLTQFMDGNRIDLTLIDISNMKSYLAEERRDPGKILLQKEPISGVGDIDDFTIFHVKAPSAKEFFDTCNEFFWLAPCVAKGLLRGELLFVKTIMEQHQFEMLKKVLDWSAALAHDFSISTGKFSKYLPRFLSPRDNADLAACFPGADIGDIWEKQFNAICLFDRHAQNVARHFDFVYDHNQAPQIMAYLQCIRNRPKNQGAASSNQ